MTRKSSITTPQANESAYLERLHELWASNWPPGKPMKPTYTQGEKPLFEYLRHWASVVPEKPAIHFYGNTLSFAELDDLSDRFARLLGKLGILPGDRVAVFMPNCPQFNIVYWGNMKSGAIHVPVSPLAKEFELRHELVDAQPSAVVCFDALLPLVRPVCKDLGIEHVLVTSYAELRPATPTIPLPDFFDAPRATLDEGEIDLLPALADTPAVPLEHTPKLDDIAALNYTGGTTGLPKGCVHTHRNILYTMASYYPLVFDESTEASDAIQLSFLPQFWIAGENTSVLLSVFSGSTMVLMARWDALGFMHAVQHYGVNHCFMLVDSVDDVLNHPDLAEYDLGSIRVTPCVSFIKKLNRDYRERWRALTGGAIMFEAAFGMTETHTCDTFTRGFQEDDFDLSFDPSFVGLPVAGTEIKIADFETGELKPLGEEGEIIIRTPSLLKGYWRKPETNAGLIENGWFKTGDLGMLTGQGFLRYLGRRKEMLKVNGMSVFPTELESIIGQNPAVAACGVVGRPDEKKGQVPVAFIILKEGSGETAESMHDWCRKAMSVYKVPEIRIMDTLPMTATGKIIKVELEQLV